MAWPDGRSSSLLSEDSSVLFSGGARPDSLLLVDWEIPSWAGVMAGGISLSLSDSSLLLSESSVFPVWAWVAGGPVFLEVPE